VTSCLHMNRLNRGLPGAESAHSENVKLQWVVLEHFLHQTHGHSYSGQPNPREWPGPNPVRGNERAFQQGWDCGEHLTI
jgi:hypothetical protein